MEEEGNPCPYDEANWLSRISFWWLTPLFITGFKRPLTTKDIYTVSKEDNSAVLNKKLERSWKQELRRYSDGQSTSLLRATLQAFRLHWLLPAILLFISESSKILAPYLVGQLIGFFTPGSTVAVTTAYTYAVALGGIGIIQMICNPLYFFIMERTSLKMKTAVGSLIYRKILSLSSQSFYQTTSGQIVNLLSTDVEKFHQAVENVHYLWLSPLVTVTCIYLIYLQCGVACFFGFGIIIIFMPLQMINGKLFGNLRTKIGRCSDKRIHTMTEIISGIKVIKMYCWEKPFSDLINSLRGKETSQIMRAFQLMGISSVFVFTSRSAMMLLILLGNWLFLGRPLTVKAVFMTFGLITVLTESAFWFLTCAVQTWSQLFASMRRVQKFLLLDEECDLATGMLHKSVIRKHTTTQFDWSVEIDHMTARWEMSLPAVRRNRKRDSTSDTSKLLHESELEHFFSLKNITLTIKKGELLAIIGSVGSGKSSLLLTLLGELPHQQGQITLLGNVGYSSQQAWIFSGTLRDNVLFGTDMDQERYTDILEACGLNKDIELMSNGDLALVGERGLMLSGGQKSRLSLARALYKDADIYLIDDPLGAVDTKVGKHIFNRCFLQILSGKTRIIVTHQLQYLQKVDRIAVLREGSLYDVGTYSELTSRGVDIETFLTTEDKKQPDDTEIDIDVGDKLLLSNTAEEVEAEDHETGTVGISVYWQYFKAGYGYFLSPLVFIFVAGKRGFMAASDWMLARWAESLQNETLHVNISKRDNSTQYTSMGDLTSDIKDWAHMPQTLQYYVIFVCAFVVCATVFSLSHFQMCAFASRRLHNKMFNFVLGAKTQFFNTNPVGRILNRFSRDLGFIDDSMTRCLYIVIDHGMMMVATTVVVCVVSPWLLIAVAPIAVFVLFIRYFSVRTTREIRRLEAISRSPVYSHVSETIGGLQTIRAFKKQEQFTESFDNYQNHHTSAWFLYLCSYRWFSLRSLFAVMIFYNIIIHVCLVLHESISSGLLAMILIYCSAWAEPFEFVMRMSAELETYMTSVQRILSYSNLKQERAKHSDKPPPPDWPSRGAVTFTDVSLRYTDDTPWALKHIDFHIKSKEKIGIVGRTGAGKSSLLAALFRLAEPNGKVWIDGLDVTKIGLHELREKISVIPQDPTLFSGTLRTNLDPFDEFKDEDLWYALEQVQLKKKIESTSGKLYMEVSESGHNFSVGQRQLICLARAVLRYNKILILDEATANVDHRTDELIQMTLRSKFRNCTVLTVAHRLNTVMDCDRIMVLDEGELKEFDVPYNLLQIQDGYFSRLVEKTGKQQASRLHALAEIAFGQRASASMLLEEAVKIATLHLHDSRDNLSKSRDSLSKSRDNLSKSKDSLSTNKDNLSKNRDSPSKTKDNLSKNRDSPSKMKNNFSNTKTSLQSSLLSKSKDSVDCAETNSHIRLSPRNRRSPQFRDSVPVTAPHLNHPVRDKVILPSLDHSNVSKTDVSPVQSEMMSPDKGNKASISSSSPDRNEATSIDQASGNSPDHCPTEPLLRDNSDHQIVSLATEESSDELLPRKHPYNPSPLARDQTYLQRISGDPTGRGARFITGVYKPVQRNETEADEKDSQKIIYC